MFLCVCDPLAVLDQVCFIEVANLLVCKILNIFKPLKPPQGTVGSQKVCMEVPRTFGCSGTPGGPWATISALKKSPGCQLYLARTWHQ